MSKLLRFIQLYKLNRHKNPQIFVCPRKTKKLI